MKYQIIIGTRVIATETEWRIAKLWKGAWVKVVTPSGFVYNGGFNR